MSTRVIHVETETTELGLRVDVTVERMPARYIASERPQAVDVPEDIRLALAAWLAEAESAQNGPSVPISGPSAPSPVYPDVRREDRP